MTMEEFATSEGITAKVEPIRKRTDGFFDQEHHDRCIQYHGKPPNYWKITLSKGPLGLSYISIQMTTGSGIPDKPTVADVLHSIQVDGQCVDPDFAGETFEEYAREMGVNEDSRREEKNWISAKDQNERVREFIGDSWQTLLRGVEPL